MFFPLFFRAIEWDRLSAWGRRFLQVATVACHAMGGTVCGATNGPVRPSPPDRNEYRRGDRPNVVLILADDLGWGTLGCYGQKDVATPNLDQLAAEGMRFTQAYAGSTVCAPSRCCLLTGRHTGHGRIRSNDESPLLAGDLTLAEHLRSYGYRTAAIGKWGLGWEGTSGRPRAKGFEEFYGYLTQLDAHNYYPPTLWRNEQPIPLRGNEHSGRRVYAPDELNLVATNVVRQFQAQPFFLYYAPTLPHANNERGTNGMEIPTAGAYAMKPWPPAERNKAAMISRLDLDVGKLLAALQYYHLEKNTIVLFTSDNGPHVEGGSSTNFFHDTGPFRGLKRDLYEGGIRVPFIARWPGHIRPGTTSDRVVAFWDFLPTIAELARTRIPENLDGQSFAPTLLGQNLPEQPPRTFYWEFHEGGYRQAARWDDWKAVRLNPDTSTELYDLAQDPGEARNIASTHPELIARAEEIFRTSADPWVKPTNSVPQPLWYQQWMAERRALTNPAVATPVVK
jgi:arylsulfatase A-like enzyme